MVKERWNKSKEQKYKMMVKKTIQKSSQDKKEKLRDQNLKVECRESADSVT